MALFGLGGSKSTVALDVGSGQVKLVEIDHSKGDPVLSRVAMTPVLADAIVEGEIMDPGVVADAIRGLFNTHGIKAKRVVVAVGGRDVIIKKIQVDRMKQAEAIDVVRWEAQQHVPFDIDAVELDFQILDPEVSRRHLQIRLEAGDGRHYAADYRSANGVYVNDDQIVGDQALDDGDRIRIGHTTLVYFDADHDDAEKARDALRKKDEWRRTTLVRRTEDE